MSEDGKDYDVGYCKPPKKSQFKPGQSGNPKGRQKGAKGFNASLKRELVSKITVREGNREVRISKAEAMAKRLTEKALKGDLKALMALLKLDRELFGNIDVHDSVAGPSGVPDPVDFDILRDFLSELQTGEENVQGKESDDDGT